MHTFENLNIVLTRMPTQKPTPTLGSTHSPWQHKLSRDIVQQAKNSWNWNTRWPPSWKYIFYFSWTESPKLGTWNLNTHPLHPPVVYSTDRSKAVVPVLVSFFVALWFILRGDLLYVFPCVISSPELCSGWAIVITFRPSSVRPSVRASVRPCVRPSVR